MTSNNSPIREPDQIRLDTARKLLAVQVSDHFQAILGCLLGEDWTTPRLVEMVITSDGQSPYLVQMLSNPGVKQ